MHLRSQSINLDIHIHVSVTVYILFFQYLLIRNLSIIHYTLLALVLSLCFTELTISGIIFYRKNIMKILIIYGTSEGQTRKIARFMEDVLQNEDHKVVIADATEEPPEPNGFDAVLIGSSIHMHKYQSSIHDFIEKNIDELNKKPSAFFSVCMAVASNIEEEHEEVHNLAKEFLKQTGLKAKEISHIAGALKYTKYDYFKRLIMRMIAKKQGGGTNTSQDYEYTDWDAVKTFVLDFIAKTDTQSKQ